MSVDASLPPLQVGQRLDRASRRLDEAGLDALIVTTLANVRYLTGFSGSAGVVLLTRDRVLLTTDGRYRTQSAEQVKRAGIADRVGIEIGGADVQRQALRDSVHDIVRGSSDFRVGLEADNVTWAASRRWSELLTGAEDDSPAAQDGSAAAEAASLATQGGSPSPSEPTPETLRRVLTVEPTSGFVEALREVKDEGEIARMARAALIADDALAEIRHLLEEAATGTVTETDVALELDSAMRRRGAEDRAFDTIVAAGPNSAKPHHQPTTRVLRRNDPVVIDFGAVFDGYRSDMTRTFCIGGEPTGELARVFEVVATSQAEGVAAVRSGIGAKDVDDVCRAVISSAGWAEAFEHGTGHGVGLDIHEAPTVSPLGTAILEPGVVVTVEPGVYLPGIGGVRIEDTLVVTSDGSRALTTFPKDVAA
jgi:Xaa-Pro aminopeptidase